MFLLLLPFAEFDPLGLTVIHEDTAHGVTATTSSQRVQEYSNEEATSNIIKPFNCEKKNIGNIWKQHKILGCWCWWKYESTIFLTTAVEIQALMQSFDGSALEKVPGRTWATFFRGVVDEAQSREKYGEILHFNSETLEVMTLHWNASFSQEHWNLGGL